MARMRRDRSVLLLGAVLLWGCTLNNPGAPPEKGKLYFPVAVALSQESEGQAARYLFVVNSNYDLRYNAGSIQAYDLEKLDKAIDACDPGKECTIRQSQYRDDGVWVDEVLIGSFASGIAVSPKGDRLYVPVRGDETLTYVNVNEGAKRPLDCGQDGDRRCSKKFRKADSEDSSYEFPREPVGVVAGRVSDFDPEGVAGLQTNAEDAGQTDAGDAGVADAEAPDAAASEEPEDFVLVAHQEGAVSLFLDRQTEPEAGGTEPDLAHVVEGLSPRVTGIAFDPATRLAYMTSVDHSAQRKSLDRVGLEFNQENPSTLYNARPLGLTGISPERDTRAVAFDSELAGRALVVARWPSSLLVVDVSDEALAVHGARVLHAVEVGDGASRLKVGRIGEDPRRFAFVSSFRAREVFVVDVDLGVPVAVVQGFSGPFELAVDRCRRRLYAADFRSSVVRIVDLRPIVCEQDGRELQADDPECVEAAEDPCGTVPLPCGCLPTGATSTRIQATLGDPSPPEELI